MYADASSLIWFISAVACLPMSLLFIRWGRLLTSALLVDLPTWRGAGERVRRALVGDGVFGGDVTMTGFIRVVKSTWSALPAMLAAGVLIVGLASCPAWAPGKFETYVVSCNAWVAPWVFVAMIIHAQLVQWRQQQGRWWIPFKILAWCVWLPAVPWVVTTVLVWTGHAEEPAGVTTGILALVVAALVPAIITRRMRRE